MRSNFEAAFFQRGSSNQKKNFRTRRHQVDELTQEVVSGREKLFFDSWDSKRPKYGTSILKKYLLKAVGTSFDDFHSMLSKKIKSSNWNAVSYWLRFYLVKNVTIRTDGSVYDRENRHQINDVFYVDQQGIIRGPYVSTYTYKKGFKYRVFHENEKLVEFYSYNKKQYAKVDGLWYEVKTREVEYGRNFKKVENGITSNVFIKDFDNLPIEEKNKYTSQNGYSTWHYYTRNTFTCLISGVIKPSDFYRYDFYVTWKRSISSKLRDKIIEANLIKKVA